MPPLSRRRPIPYSLYSILPTLVEVGLVLGCFIVKYEVGYYSASQAHGVWRAGSAGQAQRIEFGMLSPSTKSGLRLGAHGRMRPAIASRAAPRRVASPCAHDCPAPPKRSTRRAA